ncbi:MULTISPECIES: plasmid fertility inhibition factor family protein [Vreelandella]|uniref:plasmid fertility inhibition factor family protein n=1 Tax=Vreelandella TaxID=3137766 RepID=UPI0035B52E41
MTVKVTERNGVWHVPLSASHSPYQEVQFKRGREGFNYGVLIVDSEKFIALYDNNSDSITPIDKASEWSESKRNEICAFLDPSAGPCEMPRVSFSWNEARSWRSLWRAKQLPDLCFGNGRHRSRYLHYAGASCFPVEVGLDGIESLRAICGVTP